jgi:hypothetical protein
VAEDRSDDSLKTAGCLTRRGHTAPLGIVTNIFLSNAVGMELAFWLALDYPEASGQVPSSSQGVSRMTQQVTTDDSGSNAAIGASSLISTIVWSVVVLVLLAVGILLLLHYHIL